MTRRLPQNKIVYRSLTVAFLFLVTTLSMSAEWALRCRKKAASRPTTPALRPKGRSCLPSLPSPTFGERTHKASYQTHAYELAAKIPNVLHQQPCYCYCDRMGHNSLHSCFESTHGAQCATCLKELYYSYQQHKKGKTAAQIRAGIIKGEWKQIDLLAASTMN